MFGLVWGSVSVLGCGLVDGHAVYAVLFRRFAGFLFLALGVIVLVVCYFGFCGCLWW